MRHSFPATATALLLVILFVSEPICAGSIDTEKLQSLGDVDYIAFSPGKPDRDLHVFVDLPERYEETSDRYPVVYLLDGGNTFPLLAAYHHYLRFGDEAPPLILVGISYGADSFQEGNLRQTDFTAPSPERDFWGGADVFLRALETELIPTIERTYRADPDRRLLYGHSLGGQLVLFTAMHKPGLFSGLIACNPAIIGNLGYFLDADNLVEAESERVRLFLGLAEHERPELKANTLAWVQRWQATPSPWELEFRILAGQTHLSSVAEGFRHGLTSLLPSARAGDSESQP